MRTARRKALRSGLGLAAAILAGVGSAHARDFGTGAVGTTAAEFLLIDVGPRAVGMGGAYTAVANDAYSLYWNPAGLAQIPKASASLMHNRYVGDISFDYLSYAQRVTDTAVIGGAFRHMDAGSIPATDINGNGLGSVHPQAFVWEGGYGQHILDLGDSDGDITLGVTGRFAHSDLVEHANIWSGDVGVQSFRYGGFFPYRFGFVVQNMGPSFKYREVRETQPLRARLGAAISPSKYWLIALDGILPKNDQPHAALGTELTLEAARDAQAFLRAGVDTLTMWNGLDGLRGASFGLGLKTLRFTFDYSFSALGNLGNVHRFSVSFDVPYHGSRRYRER